MYDFDTIHNRRVAGDIKYEPVKGAENAIPMWVADMDFKTAPCVEEAVNKVAAKAIYGYQAADEGYREAVRRWYGRRFGFAVQDDWIVPSPAVMYSVACAIRALTDEDDAVLIFEPVYYPFSNVIRTNRRRLVISELQNVDGHYEIDFDDFEQKIRGNQVKALLFCSPHNPVGRVWTRQELEKIAKICLENDVAIISDEIHSDLVFAPHRHIPIAALSDEAAARTITCVAPTKTFNLAAIEASNMIIADGDLRSRVQREMRANCQAGVNAFGIAATKAVYTDGEEWLKELLGYLDENRRLLAGAFGQGDRISIAPPEGTYLAWLDCRRTGLTDRELYDTLLYKAGVRLHKGGTFGRSGEGYLRLNFACPHSVLKEAIDRIRSVVES